METFLYIGPGLGLGTIVLVFLIIGLVVFSIGYLLWFKLKKIFKKKK